MKAVRSFLAWAKAEDDKVDAEAKRPKLPQRVIETLSRDEVQRIEDRADSERDKLVVRLLADTGVRVGELVKLRQRDLVDRDRNSFLGRARRPRAARPAPAGRRGQRDRQAWLGGRATNAEVRSGAGRRALAEESIRNAEVLEALGRRSIELPGLDANSKLKLKVSPPWRGVPVDAAPAAPLLAAVEAEP